MPPSFVAELKDKTVIMNFQTFQLFCSQFLDAMIESFIMQSLTTTKKIKIKFLQSQNSFCIPKNLIKNEYKQIKVNKFCIFNRQSIFKSLTQQVCIAHYAAAAADDLPSLYCILMQQQTSSSHWYDPYTTHSLS